MGSSWSRSSLLIKGVPRFSEGMLCACKIFPLESLPYLLVLLSLDEEGFVKQSFLLSDGIPFFVSIFTCIL